MHVLLDAEGFVLGFQHYADAGVEGLVFVRQVGVVGILYEASRPRAICLYIDMLCHKSIVQILKQEELTRHIHHRALFALLGQKYHTRDIRFLCHKRIVRTKRRRDMYDTRTVLGGYVVARNDTESVAVGLCPRDKLLILHTDEVGAFAAPEYLWGFAQLFAVGCQTRLRQQVESRYLGIGILPAHHHIVNLRSYTEGGIARQCPRRGRPCKGIEGTPPVPLKEGVKRIGQCLIKFLNLELGGAGGVFYITVATGLVQLMRRQARTRSRRIGLNGIAFIEVAVLVQTLEQIPEGLDIFVVVGDIRVLQIHPIPHLLRQVGPLLGIFHHLAAASGVVLVHADFLADVLFGDTEHLLHTEFHRQSVGVPTRLALHLITLHGLVAAECILDSTRQYVMNTRHTVCRGGSLKEQELRVSLACRDTLVEQVFFLPVCQHLAAQFRQIQLFVLVKFLHISVGKYLIQCYLHK